MSSKSETYVFTLRFIPQMDLWLCPLEAGCLKRERRIEVTHAI